MDSFTVAPELKGTKGDIIAAKIEVPILVVMIYGIVNFVRLGWSQDYYLYTYAPVLGAVAASVGLFTYFFLVSVERKTSRKNLYRLERVGPRFREFQPPAGLPFLPPHHRPLRRREFHSKCRRRLCRRKSRRKRRLPHRRQPPPRFKRRRRLCRLPQHQLCQRRNRWSCFRCAQSWRVSRRCRLPATSLRFQQTRKFRFALR